MEIRVVRCKEWSSPDSPTLRAFVVLEIVTPDLTLELRELKYHEPVGEDPYGRKGWVITPSKPWKTADTGETKFASMYRFVDEFQYNQFREKSVEAVRNYLYPNEVEENTVVSMTQAEKTSRLESPASLGHDDIPF